MRVVIALFFSLLFAIVLTAPTVISLTDETQELSIFLDLNDEEENKKEKNGEESKTDAEVKLLTASQQGISNLNKIINGCIPANKITISHFYILRYGRIRMNYIYLI